MGCNPIQCPKSTQTTHSGGGSGLDKVHEAGALGPEWIDRSREELNYAHGQLEQMVRIRLGGSNPVEAVTSPGST